MKKKFLFMKNSKSGEESRRVKWKNFAPRKETHKEGTLDYHSEPSVTIKSMRIKRESPCLGLRFMPIKLSKFIEVYRDVMTKLVAHETSHRTDVCVLPPQERTLEKPSLAFFRSLPFTHPRDEVYLPNLHKEEAIRQEESSKFFA